MSEFPSLAEVIREHEIGHDMDRGFVCVSIACDWTGHNFDFPEHQADAWREACTIRTVEELDALPPGTIVRLGNDLAAQKRDGLDWFMANDEGYEFSGEMIAMNDYALPALLIWSPDWNVPQ